MATPTMSEAWYRAAGAREPLTQGDLIFDCPALSWRPSAIQPHSGSTAAVLLLGDHVMAEARDLVVMTQACDLEHVKVANVVLCPHYGLDEFRSAWEEDQRRKDQNPTARAWRRYCDEICEGIVWNLNLLNAQDDGASRWGIASWISTRSSRYRGRCWNRCSRPGALRVPSSFPRTASISRRPSRGSSCELDCPHQ